MSPTSLCHGLSHLASQLGPAVSPQQGQGHVAPTGGTCFVLCPWEVQGNQRGKLAGTHGKETKFPPQNTGESQKGSTPRASHTINTPHRNSGLFLPAGSRDEKESIPPSLPSALLAVGRAQGQDCLWQGVQSLCSRLLQVSHVQVMGMTGIEPVVGDPRATGPHHVP